MSVINSQPLIGASGQAGYNLTKSLRFRSSASAYLNRTPTVASNRTTWTWSAWVKRGALGGGSGLFCAGTAGTDDTFIGFNSNDTFGWFNRNSSSVNSQLTTTQVFRDPAAWYNIVVVWNTTNGTSSNRMMIYVNGVQITSFTTTTYPSSSQTSNTNNNVATYIGQQLTSGNFFDGYLSEVNFIDGQALTPSSFGETSTTTGVWIPKKYTGTYGTNGFYLPFTNTTSTATLGTDFSGNSNTWTVNNISLTAGSTYDSMNDVPTNTSATASNFAVLSPIDKGTNMTVLDANLQTTSSAAAWTTAVATIGITSGKWYWEYALTSGTDIICGIVTNQATRNNHVGGDAYGWGYYRTGQKVANNTFTSYAASYTSSDTIGVAFDADNGTLTFYKNNTSQGTAFTGLTGSTYFPANSHYQGATWINFGQQPFSYTPPTGFVALNTFNLPTPTIGATASTQADNYFNALTYAGSASNQTISGLDFQPDFIWFKERTTGGIDHNLFDSQRSNYGSRLISNTTSAEAASSAIISVSSTGYSLLGGVSSTNDAFGRTYVTWNWKANGAGSTNTAGSITSTVSANTTAGFSVVTYTGNATNGATVGHGLGVSPSMIIGKIRSTTDDWYVWQTAMGDNFMKLNTTAAQLASTANGVYNTASFSSTVFALGSGSTMNASGGTYVAYCFAQIAGYSAFGSYTGNGSTDGTFVFTGFRPRFIMIKCSSATGDWVIFDTSRNLYNSSGKALWADLSDAEGTYTDFDILSNGFKLRFTSTTANGSGNTYIYMAFAENPFKYANAR